MLSAVAARKARLQAQKTQETAPGPAAPAVTAASSPPKASTPKPKRKSGTQSAPTPAQKKPRKDTSKPRKQAQRQRQTRRYFVQEDEEDAGEDADSDARPLADSSDDDDDDGHDNQHNDEQPAPARTPALLTTFTPLLNENTFPLTPSERASLSLSSSTPALILVLPPDPTITLTLLGTARLRVLCGALSLLGTPLSPSTTVHPIFAPRSSPLPTLTPVPTEAHAKVEADLAPLPDRVAQRLRGRETVIVLQEMHSGVEDLGRVVRTFDGVFQAPPEDADPLPLSGISLVSRLVNHPHRDIQPFHLPPSWSAALDAVSAPPPDSAQDPPVYLVKGPKNAGKSTFARTLLNRLVARYRRVAYLECDLGQSEFTPGGMVALTVVDRPLFGPPFTHPTLPYQAHYIGATSPRASPAHYLAALAALVQTYRLDLHHGAVLADAEDDGADARIADRIPLVVNTMGWSKGLGADLTRKIEAILLPTHVLDLRAVPALALAAIPPTAHSARFTSADHRTLALLAYFHAVFPSPSPSLLPAPADTWTVHAPLCAVPPYAVAMGAAFDRVVLTGAGAEDVVPSEVPRVLNVALVALLRTDDEDEDEAMRTDKDAPRYVQGAAPPDPLTSACLGLALVRAISPGPALAATTTVHLLTPLPPALLGAGRTLVKGELELPVWGMLDWTRADGAGVAGVEAGRVPFLRWAEGRKGALGGERRRVRRNLMRKGLM
ncbi:hypothetical protein OF83DRAFT_1268857 [Amylostereum chailletii]|nr:hypothetical protein OF83DRAFT_1268857 [Amylostereum chailletii]